VARAHLAGRWPDVSSEGNLEGKALRLQTFAVRQASARWRVGTGDDRALDGHVVLDGVDADGRALDRIQADIAGTARSHRAEVRIASALLPPAWTDALLARPAGAASATAASAPASLPSGSSASRAPSTSSSTPPAPPAPGSRSVLRLVAEGGLVDVGGSRAGGWRGTLREAVARSVATPTTTWLDARDVRAGVVWAGAPVR